MTLWSRHRLAEAARPPPRPLQTGLHAVSSCTRSYALTTCGPCRQDPCTGTDLTCHVVFQQEGRAAVYGRCRCLFWCTPNSSGKVPTPSNTETRGVGVRERTPHATLHEREVPRAAANDVAVVSGSKLLTAARQDGKVSLARCAAAPSACVSCVTSEIIVASEQPSLAHAPSERIAKLALCSAHVTRPAGGHEGAHFSRH